MTMVGKLRLYAFAFIIYLLWIAAVFDPIGSFFKLRYIALIGAVSCLVLSGLYLQLFNRNTLLKGSLIVYISLIMPIYGFFMYMIQGGYSSEFIDTSYAAAGILLSLSLIYKNEFLCKVGISAMVFSLRLLVITVILIYANTTISTNDQWISFFTERNTALISTREYVGVTLPYIYFLSSPMLIYLIAYDLNKLFDAFSLKYVLMSGMSIFAFALSGTRAHMILAVAYVPLFYILAVSKHKLLLSTTCLFLITMTINVLDIEMINSFFTTEETSNAIKIGMLTNYADIFNDPLTFIFGQGYNAHEWSAPLREMIALEENASKTELTYLELIRVYGLLISIPFFALLIILVYRLAQLHGELKWLLPSLMIYLLNCSINPYLFATNGMIPLGLIVSITSMRFITNERNYRFS